MLYNLPDTVCGAQRIPYRLTAGIPDIDPYYAIWCEAENTTSADKVFSVEPSDVFFHGLLLHPTHRHYVVIKLLKMTTFQASCPDIFQAEVTFLLPEFTEYSTCVFLMAFSTFATDSQPSLHIKAL